MKRILVLTLFLVSCGEGRLSPQGGTTTSIQGGNGLTGGGTGAVTLHVVGATGGGLSVLSNSVGLKTDCSSTQVLKWDGDSWECAADTDTGITNSAGANVIMKSDGTNAIASPLSANSNGNVTVAAPTSGTTMSVTGASGGVPLTVTQSGSSRGIDIVKGTKTATFRLAGASDELLQIGSQSGVTSVQIGPTATSAPEITITTASTSIINSVTIGDAVTDSHNVWGDTLSREAVGATFTGAAANFYIIDTTSMAQGVGGQICFQGSRTGTTVTNGACIKTMKTNATDNNTSFDLVFGTRLNGAGDVAEVLRIGADKSLTTVGAVKTSGIISPAAITGTQNDWAPTDNATAVVVKISSSGNITLNGFAAGSNPTGRHLWLIYDGAHDVTWSEQSGSNSSSTSRFNLKGVNDITWTKGTTDALRGCTMHFVHDGTEWVMVDGDISQNTLATCRGGAA